MDINFRSRGVATIRFKADGQITAKRGFDAVTLNLPFEIVIEAEPSGSTWQADSITAELYGTASGVTETLLATGTLPTTLESRATTVSMEQPAILRCSVKAIAEYEGFRSGGATEMRIKVFLNFHSLMPGPDHRRTLCQTQTVPGAGCELVSTVSAARTTGAKATPRAASCYEAPTVQVAAGPTPIMGYQSTGPASATSIVNTGATCVAITATGQPAGGTFRWSTSSSGVTLQNATAATVTVCSAAGYFSQNRGDVAVNVTYSADGETSSAATTTVTVLKPSALTTLSDATNATGHQCIQGSGPFTAASSYYTDTLSGARYTSYVRTRNYSLQDQFGSTIALSMVLNESYSPPVVTIGSGVGSQAPDFFVYCSQTCRQGGSDSVSATQTIYANNVALATKAVNWTCSGVTVNP